MGQPEKGHDNEHETNVQETRTTSVDEQDPMPIIPVQKAYNARAILACIGAFFALFITTGFFNAFGSFQSYYHEHQLSHKSESAISWIGSFGGFGMFVTAIPAGILVDRIGPTPLLAVGSIGLVLATFMTSLCQKYYQFFLAQAVLLGLSMGFITIPSMSTVTKHFTTNRGIASGFTVAGSSLGGVIWPIMLDQLLNKNGTSFASTVRIVGYVMVPLGLLATVLVRPPKQEKLVKSSDIEARPNATEVTKKKVDLSIIRKPVFLFVLAGATVFNLAMFTPFFFVTSYAISLGHSASFAFYLLAALSGASFFGRIGLGGVADKYGPFNLLSVAAILSAMIAFCWTAATSKTGLIIYCLAYGFISGACLSLELQCVTAIATPETHGTVMGLAFGGMSITGLIGNPIAGALVPVGWLAMSMFAGATLLVGAVLVVLSRLSLSRQLRVKV